MQCPHPCGFHINCHVPSGPVTLGAPIGFSVAVVPSPTRGFRPEINWAAAPRTWRPAENWVLGACRWPPPRRGRWALSALHRFRAPRWGCPWRVPPALLSCCLRCGGLGSVDPVTHASPFPCRLPLDGALGRCTRGISCGRRLLPFRVGGRHAQVPCVCACACFAWLGYAGWPPGRVLVRLTIPVDVVAAIMFRLASSGLESPFLSGLLLFFPLLRASSRPCCLRLCVSPAPVALGLGAVGWPPSPLFICFFRAPSVASVSLVSCPCCLGPWRPLCASSAPALVVFFLLRCPMLLCFSVLWCGRLVCFPPPMGWCPPPRPTPPSLFWFCFVPRPGCLRPFLVSGLRWPGSFSARCVPPSPCLFFVPFFLCSVVQCFAVFYCVQVLPCAALLCTVCDAVQFLLCAVRRVVVLYLVVLFLMCFAVLRCCVLCCFLRCCFLSFFGASGCLCMCSVWPWCVLLLCWFLLCCAV